MSKKPEGISKSLVHGSLWIFLKIFIVNSSNIFVIAYLARQLTPKEFGLVALANVMLRFISVVASQGVSEYVINTNNQSEFYTEKLSAAFWMDTSFSILSLIIGLALVVPLSIFYNEPGLKNVLLILLLNFILTSTAKIPEALVAKDLRFKQLEIRNIFLSLSSGIISIVLVVLGFGVYSLILPTTILAPIRIIIAFSLANWLPQFKVYIKYWREIFKYSSYVISGTLTSYLITEGDSIFIGKLLGTKALGIYNLGWQNAHLPVRNLNSVISRIGLPTFAKFNGNLGQLKGALNKMMGLLATSTVPFLIFLFIAADDFVLTIYGKQWIESIIILRILIVFVLRYSLGNPTGMIYKTLNRPDITFKFGLVMLPFYFLSIWIGSFYGIIGVATGLTIVRTLFGFADFKIVSICLKCSFMDIIKPVLNSIKASLIMGAFVFIIKLILTHSGSHVPLVNLAILAISAAVSYLILVRFFFHSIAFELNAVSSKVLGKYNIYFMRILNLKTT